jgi:hypothetical protein
VALLDLFISRGLNRLPGKLYDMILLVHQILSFKFDLPLDPILVS